MNFFRTTHPMILDVKKKMFTIKNELLMAKNVDFHKKNSPQVITNPLGFLTDDLV